MTDSIVYIGELYVQIITPGSEPDAVHVVIDRHIVTGQNEQSTLTAVQNLILLYNQK